MEEKESEKIISDAELTEGDRCKYCGELLRTKRTIHDEHECGLVKFTKETEETEEGFMKFCDTELADDIYDKDVKRIFSCYKLIKKEK